MRKLTATVAATLTLVAVATASTTNPTNAANFGFHRERFVYYDETPAY